MQVGVQMIAPWAIAVRVKKLDEKSFPEQKCLLLPEVGSSGQPTSLICPSLLFKVGDRLRLDDERITREIELNRLLESSGAISQFQFIYLDQPRGHESREDDTVDNVDFETLWTSL
jgi:hypothetical protein